MPDVSVLPGWSLALLFAGAAACIWAAGVRLASAADEVADRTGLGAAFLGALLLGGVTSLPEAASTLTASTIGNAPLAVNNIFGGIALQVTMLAVADWVARGRALSARVTDDTVLTQAPLLIAVLGIAAAGTLLDDVAVFGTGVAAMAVFVAAMLAFFLMHQHETPGRWRPRREGGDTAEPPPSRQHSRRHLVLTLVATSAIILVAGVALAATADAIATRTGLGASFMGAAVLALATSLPELSTTLGAIRIGAYAMAYANIFGANILDASLILLADVAYPGPPVLNEVGIFAAVAAVLGMVLTAVWLVGLVERRRTVVLGVGADSAAVLVLYVVGLAVLYSIR